MNNIFSLAGDPDTPYVNLMTLQPFVNFNFGKTGWYAVSSPIINASWNARGGDVWTVPVTAINDRRAAATKSTRTDHGRGSAPRRTH